MNKQAGIVIITESKTLEKEVNKMTSKSQGEETKSTKTPFSECMEQMMSACGPEIKQRMEACSSNIGKACSNCCGTQTKTETIGKRQ